MMPARAAASVPLAFMAIAELRCGHRPRQEAAGNTPQPAALPASHTTTSSHTHPGTHPTHPTHPTHLPQTHTTHKPYTLHHRFYVKERQQVADRPATLKLQHGGFAIPLTYCPKQCNGRGACTAGEVDATAGSCRCFKGYEGGECERSISDLYMNNCLNNCNGEAPDRACLRGCGGVCTILASFSLLLRQAPPPLPLPSPELLAARAFAPPPSPSKQGLVPPATSRSPPSPSHFNIAPLQAGTSASFCHPAPV
jgi:hypothetical protein